MLDQIYSEQLYNEIADYTLKHPDLSSRNTDTEIEKIDEHYLKTNSNYSRTIRTTLTNYCTGLTR